MQESTLRDGLSYTQVFRVILTGREYIVPFELRSQDIQAPLIHAQNKTADIRWNVEHMNSSYEIVTSLQKSLRNFDREFVKMFKDMNNFLHYIINSDVHPLNRVRRGALNFIGSIFNILFGVATHQQVDTIHQRLQSTETLTEKERIMLNVHSSTLNITLGGMSALQAVTRRLEDAVNVSHSFITKRLHTKGEQRMLEALLNLELAII